MDPSTTFGLIIVALLVLANGFFVATEFAIVAVRRSRLEQLAAEGSVAAQSAKEVVGHLDTYIAACQLGITMASLALGWLGEPAFAHLVEPPLEALVGEFAPAASHGVAVGTSFAIITALHIVIGELAPKGLALQKPEATTLFVSPPLRLFELVFRWPIALLNGVGNGVLRLFGLKPATGHEMVHSVEELRMLVAGMQQAGVVEAAEARIATRAFRFGNLDAGALMTPRTEVLGVSIDASREEVLACARESGRSRLVVYEGSLDQVAGVLHIRDLLVEMSRPEDRWDLRSLIRPPLVVPEGMAADDVLERMRAERRQLALVLDEFGGTAGIVTLEDLVEALVGRVGDDAGPAAADTSVERQTATPEQPGELVLDGLLRLEEVEELTGVPLAAESEGLVDSLGGLVMHRLGRIPQEGDRLEVGAAALEVLAMDGRRVASVRFSTTPPPPPLNPRWER